MPAALNSQCGYELFWHLNPRRLEPFFEARNQRTKTRMVESDGMAWMIGGYVRQAVASCFNRSASYPQKPMYTEKYNETGKEMTDAERFRLFATQHNKALKRKRRKKNAEDR